MIKHVIGTITEGIFSISLVELVIIVNLIQVLDLSASLLHNFICFCILMVYDDRSLENAKMNIE